MSKEIWKTREAVKIWSSSERTPTRARLQTFGEEEGSHKATRAREEECHLGLNL